MDNNKSPLNKTPFGAPRRDVREIFRKASSDQGGLHKFTMPERIKLEKELFPSKVGEHINPLEYRATLKALNSKLFREKSELEKAKIRDEINILKKLDK